MCVNGSKEDEMVSLNIDDLVLGSTACEVYLGSAITNSNKLSDDVNADIKLRQVGGVNPIHHGLYKNLFTKPENGWKCSVRDKTW